MKEEEKSAILSLVVRIVSRIREDCSDDKVEKEKNLMALSNFLKNLTVQKDGEVFAVFSNDFLESKND